MENFKPKVAFICVHNSCRSQMAEALGKLFAADAFDSYSGGIETKPQINQDAVRLIKEIYNVDMEATQTSKLVTDLPECDIVIKMGCAVYCPFFPGRYEENWDLEDPTGKSDDEFKIIIDVIERNIKHLAQRILNNEITYEDW